MTRPGVSGILLLAAAAALLAGCVNESASLRFPGPDHALTLSLRQAWPWSKDYELDAVMQRLPDCHRRSRMDNAAPADLKVELFQAPEGAYAEPILILKQGARHYALGTQNCEMQRFKAAPKELGPRLGSFELEAGELKFVAAPKPAGAAVAAAQPATPAPAPPPAPVQ